MPIPEDLRSSFIDAVWQSLAWKRTTWLGHPIESAPTDLIAYQQAIASVRPDCIVETGTGDGARTLFLASICDLLDHGQVVSVGEGLSEDLPAHPRITYVDAVIDDDATLDRVRALIGLDARTLVVLGSREKAEPTRRSFERLRRRSSRLAHTLIVTDTIVNGHPVWTGFGPGPYEALSTLLQRHGEFFADPELERFGLDVQSRRLPAAHSMKTFCLGLNKTGTRSLSEALEILGYPSLHWGGDDPDMALRRGPEIRVAVERALADGRPLLEDVDDVDAYSDILALSTISTFSIGSTRGASSS